jgi:hypothetical protein
LQMALLYLVTMHMFQPIIWWLLTSTYVPVTKTILSFFIHSCIWTLNGHLVCLWRNGLSFKSHSHAKWDHQNTLLWPWLYANFTISVLGMMLANWSTLTVVLQPILMI